MNFQNTTTLHTILQTLQLPTSTLSTHFTHILITPLDFILGHILNPLLIFLFSVIFVFSWSFFLGVVGIGFGGLAWRERGRLRGVWRGVGGAGGDGVNGRERRDPAPGSVGYEIPKELRDRMRAVMGIDGQVCASNGAGF